jgi:hypothetical protein
VPCREIQVSLFRTPGVRGSLSRRRSDTGPAFGTLPVARAVRPSVPHPSARLPHLRRRHARDRLHHRDRPVRRRVRYAIPLSFGVPGGPSWPTRETARRSTGPSWLFISPYATSASPATCEQAARDCPRTRTSGRERSACPSCTGLGGAGTTATGVCLRTGGAVFAPFRRRHPRLVRRHLHPGPGRPRRKPARPLPDGDRIPVPAG